MKDQPTQMQASMLDGEEVSLNSANTATRAKRYDHAVNLYLQLLKKKPALQGLIVQNLDLVRSLRFLERKKHNHTRTLICGNQSTLERILLLAGIHHELSEISLLSWEIAKDDSVQVDKKNSYLPLKQEYFYDDLRAIEQAFEWVVSNPADYVHLVGLNGINFFLAIFYKSIWSSQITFDIFNWQSELQNSAVENFVIDSFDTWQSKNWQSCCNFLAQVIGNISVASPALQVRTGGQILRNIKIADVEYDKFKLRKKYLVRQTSKLVLLTYSENVKKAVLETMMILTSLPDADIVFALLGEFKEGSENISLNSQHQDEVRILQFDKDQCSEALAISDALLIMKNDDDANLLGYPPELPDALAKSIPVFAFSDDNYDEFISCGYITGIEHQVLKGVFESLFSDPGNFVAMSHHGAEDLLSKYSLEKNLNRLKALQSENHFDRVKFKTLLDKLCEHLPVQAQVAKTICSMPLSTLPFAIELEDRDSQKFRRMLIGVILQFGYEVELAENISQLLANSNAELFLNKVFEIFFQRRPEPHESLHFLAKLNTNSGRIETLTYLLQCDEVQQLRQKNKGLMLILDEDEARHQAARKQGIGMQISTDIVFPRIDQALVSVIIPVYGKIEYTLAALRSIQKNLPTVKFEIIVVDDRSPDSSLSILKQIDTVKVIENQENLGFIRSCNHGAKHAKGDYLCFLNNDTEVKENWLDALVQTFRDFPGTGLVGSKLVYPDGRLQEAGGILWNDASAWNFGKFQDPALPELNYAREVDFCSGASILIPRALFEQLGGFDEHYLPAYYEDVDLALKVRQQGLRVLYQPLSCVIHFEGITSGTDLTQGVKSSQVRNQKKLFDRWESVIKSYQENGQFVDKAKDRSSRYRALVIDHCTPTPDRDAGSVLTFNLLLLLREMGFQVSFVPEDNYLFMPEYTPALQQRGIEVLYAPHVTNISQHLAEKGGRYDLVLVFRPGAAEKHLPAIKTHCPSAKFIYHTVDLHYLRMQRQSECNNDLLLSIDAESMKSRELSLLKQADASIVVSTKERGILELEVPEAAVFVLPLVLQIRASSSSFEQRSDIVFVGGFQHQPNIDAVEYFVTNMMPILRKRSPQVRLFIIGSNIPAEIQGIAGDDVIVRGFVEDLPAALDDYRVAIAPLRYGAGVKGKIASAMCAGIPCVATSIATEGMSIQDGHDVMVADTAQGFADAIIRLYTDKNLWSTIQENALRTASQLWGSEAAWGQLQLILESQGFKIADQKNDVQLYQ